MSAECLVVLCTFPDVETARRIAMVLVEKKLAACVNLCPGIESIYSWEGKVEKATEILGIIKTTPERYAALEVEVKAQHPYDVPEVLALPVGAGAEGYLNWIKTSVTL